MSETTPPARDPDGLEADDDRAPTLPSWLPPRTPPGPQPANDGPPVANPDPGARPGRQIAADEIPAFADGVLRPLDPASLRGDSITSWITTGVLTLPAGIGIAIVAVTNGVNKWVWVGWCAALLFFVLLAIISPPLAYRWTRYGVSERGVEIRRGWLWRRALTVPRSRVQHTDVTQGPLMRKLGIAKLTIYTAGTVNNSVELSGLSHSRAESIRDFLVHHRAESDGV